MATYKDVVAKARRMIVDYPEKKGAIIDLVEMCRDEIEDGGSESHEAEMALEDLGDIENGTYDEEG